jgi:hypothetical protein
MTCVNEGIIGCWGGGGETMEDEDEGEGAVDKVFEAGYVAGYPRSD